MKCPTVAWLKTRLSHYFSIVLIVWKQTSENSLSNKQMAKNNNLRWLILVSYVRMWKSSEMMENSFWKDIISVTKRLHGRPWIKIWRNGKWIFNFSVKTKPACNIMTWNKDVRAHFYCPSFLCTKFMGAC